MAFTWLTGRRKGSHQQESAPVALLPAREESETQAAYATSNEHLWDELRRIDQLVRALVIRRQHGLPVRPYDEVPDPELERRSSIRAFLRSTFATPHYLPPELEELLQPHWTNAAEIADEISARLKQTPDTSALRVRRLQQTFDLSDLERDVVLVCLLSEVDDRYRQLFDQLEMTAGIRAPTIRTVVEILSPVLDDLTEGRALFEAQGNLRRYRLVVISGDVDSTLSLLDRSIRLDDRIATYLLGGDHPDERLTRRPIRTEQPSEPRLDHVTSDIATRQRLRGLASWWSTQRAHQTGMAVFLVGPDASILREAALAVCSLADMPLLIVSADPQHLELAAWREVVELACREAMLRDAALYWEDCEALLSREQPPEFWQELISGVERYAGLTFLGSHIAWDWTGHASKRAFLRFDLPEPDIDLRHRRWQALFPPTFSYPSFQELDAFVEEHGLAPTDLREIAVEATFVALSEAEQHKAIGIPSITIAHLRKAMQKQKSRGSEATPLSAGERA